MSESPAPHENDPLVRETRLRSDRHRTAEREGPPSLARRLAQVGVLGWMVVAPALAGLFAGRWLDRHFASGLFCTAPLLLLGLVLGCWTAWKWMQQT